ncbi:hypothetical protein ABW19_dt0200272 [Dactylella cylindrospora]|nr:hypothetical protein ABW19_dt0200272 [Dactylella cylindrospora]
MLEKTSLVLGLIAYLSSSLFPILGRSLHASFNLLRHRYSTSQQLPDSEKRNIVIVGGNFAGYYAARYIASVLPPGSPFHVVVVEPRSHFNFTWVLPRFCVVEGHEHKAFIPYSGFLAALPQGKVTWIRDRVIEAGKNSVKLQGGREIPYEFLIIATGSGANSGLPSRLDADDKSAAMEELKAVQQNVKGASRLVVVGGGAAGVELATDAKSLYPEKSVTLIHSRDAVMHRFGPELQRAALDGLHQLGVEVVLGERVVNEDKDRGLVTLRSGREISCDLIINCTGQKPTSNLVSQFSPSSVSESGYIRVKPTMQIADESFSNVYACGDVTDTHIANPNARAAFCQALVVVDNVLSATKGKAPKRVYKPHWADASIKLTLGLEKTLIYTSDGSSNLMFESKKGDIALDSWKAWRQIGSKPFEDPDYAAESTSASATKP